MNLTEIVGKSFFVVEVVNDQIVVTKLVVDEVKINTDGILVLDEDGEEYSINDTIPIDAIDKVTERVKSLCEQLKEQDDGSNY